VCGLDEARRQAIAATRQLAKRQLTWLRARPAAQWIDSARDDVENVILDALLENGMRQ
jgi:tRNA dimethylallyltransferase